MLTVYLALPSYLEIIVRIGPLTNRSWGW